MVSRQLSLLSLLSFVLISGCSGSGGSVDRIPTVPASGTVTLDGTSYGPATLDLIPLTKTGDRVRSASATVKDDGSFVVGTYEDKDGIIPGEYSVLVNVPLDSASPAPNVEAFQFTVGSEGDKNIVIALKSKKGNAGTLLSPSLKEGGVGTGL